MMFKKFFSYILGYVNIEIEGYFIERFINICLGKKIFLSNTKIEKSTILNTNITISDFKRIKEIAKATKCRVKIVKKKGIPFLIKKYRKRKIFIILLLTVALSIYISSLFIWNIEIKGETSISKNEIIEMLEEYGLKVGKLKKNVNSKYIINEIRLRRNDIAWVGMQINGTNVIIEIVDGTKKPEIINEEEYCNIVSNKEGMITKVNVQNGIAMVKPGDIVKPGTLLVRGFFEGKYTGIRYVHSQATIEAKVWYSEKIKMYKNVEEDVKTGEKENKYEIKINNFKINFYKTLSKFKNYDTIEETKKLKLFSNFYLPIELIKKTNYETKKETVKYEYEELKNQAITQLEEKLKSNIEGKQVLNRQINCENENEYIILEIIYEVQENIGTNEKIIF